MAVKRKSFKTKKAGTDDVVELELNDAVFRCNSRIPGMVLVDFVSGMDKDDPAAMGLILGKMVKAAIKADDYERFMAYVRDPENDVDLESLAEICGWLAEQYTGDSPTQPSQASSAGSATDGPGSSGSHFEPALTSAR